ncbi:MAG: hypothetical protein AAFV37_10280 [Pseudomonadota bacterium]
MVRLGIVLLVAVSALIACTSRNIYSIDPSDQRAFDRAALVKMAYAAITSDNGQRDVGPSLIVFEDGACVTAMAPCRLISEISSVEIAKDEGRVPGPLEAVGTGALIAAYALSTPNNSVSTDWQTFDESKSAWIDLKTVEYHSRVMRLRSDRMGFEPIDARQNPCSWKTVPLSPVPIQSDDDAAAYIVNVADEMSGACLLSVTNLIAQYEPSQALDVWMLGAARIRWERLQCKNAVTDMNESLQPSGIELAGFAFPDPGRVSPAGFLIWSMMSFREAKEIMGDSLAEFEEATIRNLSDENTFSYTPPLERLCARSGGVASDEVRRGRQQFMTEFSMMSDAESKLFHDDKLVSGRAAILEFRAPVQDER